MKETRRCSFSAFCLLLSDFKEREMKENGRCSISAFCPLLSEFKS
jgi:hypothetical protein